MIEFLYDREKSRFDPEKVVRTIFVVTEKLPVNTLITAAGHIPRIRIIFRHSHPESVLRSPLEISPP